MGQNTRHKEEVEKLAQQLRDKPELIEPIKTLLGLIECETGPGVSADQIEERIVGLIRKVGKASLQEWAQRANAVAQAQGHAHAKKSLVAGHARTDRGA